jgi:NAD-dependent SIR2 family protein deacetylase
MPDAPRPTGPAAELAAFVRRHPRLVVLTGAGCSTASGIPDYRDANGAWKHRRPVDYAEFVGSAATRRRSWARSLLGWPRIAAARPNPSHLALARLEARGHVLRVVTQNVDGLHQRAGSREVLDLHGRLDRASCLGCGREMSRAALQERLSESNPRFAAVAAGGAPDGDSRLDAGAADLAGFRVPECPACGGILKPGVVFFGESVPRRRVEAALAALESADALLVVGSSLMVFSGYRFCLAARRRGLPVAAVNRGRTRADELLALKVDGECGAVLGALAGELDLRPGALPARVSG